MTRHLLTCASVALALMMAIIPANAQVGRSLGHHTLSKGNDNIVGLAYDDQDDRLYVLDSDRTIYTYLYNPSTEALTPSFPVTLPSSLSGSEPVRGLGFAREGGARVLYYARLDGSTPVRTHLCRATFPAFGGSATTTCMSLEGAIFGLTNKEAWGIAVHDDSIYISYPPTSVSNGVLVLRGKYGFGTWAACRTNPYSWCDVQHRAASQSNRESRGLAIMPVDGETYLWGTVGTNGVYVADAPSGRALFRFEHPRSEEPWVAESNQLGLAFGANVLWVSERKSGRDRVHRVNVLSEYEVRETTPWRVRDWVFRLKSRHGSGPTGTIRHNFARPFPVSVLPNQDRSDWRFTYQDYGARTYHYTTNVGGDVDTPQRHSRTKYVGPPLIGDTYTSEVRFRGKTRRARLLVYPHLVTTARAGGMASANYMGDDNHLYKMDTFTNTYANFVARVEDYVKAKYTLTDARMDHAYWAGRNIVEYILDHYHYPTDNHPATFDYLLGHYNANPAPHKMVLSDGDYDGDELMACSGTSVVVAGAMRFLGFDARWVGATDQGGPVDPSDDFCAGSGVDCTVWDNDGILSPGEWAVGKNGHRWAQVWMGPIYGWQQLDGTPIKPADEADIADAPPAREQSLYMQRVASDDSDFRNRDWLVTTIGSGKFTALVKDHDLSNSSDCWDTGKCGPDQRYNLTARHTSPGSWAPSSRIYVGNPLALNAMSAIHDATADTIDVDWSLVGPWSQADPDATLRVIASRNGVETVLATGLQPSAGAAVVPASMLNPGVYGVIVQKDGDPDTAGVTVLLVY